MRKIYLKLLAPLLFSSLLAMPAGAEEPEGLGEEAAEPETSSSALVFDAKGVARPVTSYEAAETAASREKQDTAKAKEKDKNKNKDGQEETAADNGISAENPMYVTADRMRYNDTTGDVDAMGRVVIRHMLDTYQTEYVYGNSIAQKYVIPGEVHWVNPTTRLKAERADYDRG